MVQMRKMDDHDHEWFPVCESKHAEIGEISVEIFVATLDGFVIRDGQKVLITVYSPDVNGRAVTVEFHQEFDFLFSAMAFCSSVPEKVQVGWLVNQGFQIYDR